MKQIVTSTVILFALGKVVFGSGIVQVQKRLLRFIIVLSYCYVNMLNAQQRPADLVYPQLDAAHSRWFFFSSACRPFGMVSLFPDNNVGGEWESGYRYSIDTIQCFSHIHEWQLSGIAVMPVAFKDDDLSELFTNYASPFSHQTEKIIPGYHRVELSRYQIKAELTATDRTGFHRYKFYQQMRHGLIIDLGGHLGPSDMLRGGFQKMSDHEVRGFMVNGPTMRRPKECPVYFSALFNQPIRKIWLFQNGKITESISEWNGKNGKILIEFEDTVSELMMKMGVSFTDENGAAKNRETELPGWAFDKAVGDATTKWNSMLSRIKIEGGTLQQQQRFYTDLWHSIQGRRIISDADGQYADCTGSERVIKQLPLNERGKPAFNMYNSDAFWGAQWTINTLWQLVYPEISEEFCNSFLQYYRNGGLIPRGPSGGNYTYVMTGASSTPFFVSAYQKGIRGFDISLAYEGLKKNHMPGGMMSKAGYEHNTAKGGGLEFYMEHGYVPYPLSDTAFGAHQDGAAMTLEYAYQDWTLSQLAKSLNKNDDQDYFLKRSANYRNLFNHSEGFIIPKDKNGNWNLPFDPLLYEHGFEEANGAHYLWFVPHDLKGLFDLMGGKDSAAKRLNWEFEQTEPYRFCNEHPENMDEGIKEEMKGLTSVGAPSRKYVNDKRTWINYSNQPSIQTAFIFNYAGYPWLTQYWSRMVVDSAYSKLSPYFGYNGDEDQGLMSSLSVLMKIGLFQMTGGCEEDPVYEIGSPLFKKISIQLDPKYFNANSFVIETKNNTATNRYIQSASINKRDLNKYYFHQSDINKGGGLLLLMGKMPNKKWGISNTEN